MESYSTIYRGQFKKILGSVILIGLLVGILTILRPLQYSATGKLLVIQRAAFTLDPYTAIRSVELISDNLGRIVKTSSFFEKVLQSGFNIDGEYFYKEEDRRRRQWINMTDASPVRGTGLLEIKVYHKDREQAVQIANSIIFLLTREGSDYIGREVGIRLVDQPIVSRYPVKPSIPLNVLAGLFVGFLIGHLWGYVDHRNKRHRGVLI